MQIVQFLAIAVIVSFRVANGEFSKSEFVELPGTSRIILGSGVNSRDLPIAKCAYTSDFPSNTTCLIATRDGSRCNSSYFTTTDTAVTSVTQLPGNKVLVHVRQSWSGHDSLLVKDNLTLIDMSSCERVYNVSLPVKANQVIPYEDGSYDVVLVVREGKSKDDSRLEHYDANGRRSGESLNISLGWGDTHVQAASTKSRDRGLFVRGHRMIGQAPIGLKLVAIRGSQLKDVLELPSDLQALVSHVDADRYYTACGRRSDSRGEKVECKRLDLQTEKVLEATFDWTKSARIRDVRASDAGIMLFGVQESDYQLQKLIVAETRKDEEPIVRMIDPPWNATVKGNCQVRDFDGAARSFTFACEVISPKQGVAFHKFDLRSNT